MDKVYHNSWSNGQLVRTLYPKSRGSTFTHSGVPMIPGGLVVKGKLSLTALRKLNPIHKKGS